MESRPTRRSQGRAGVPCKPRGCSAKALGGSPDCPIELDDDDDGHDLHAPKTPASKAGHRQADHGFPYPPTPSSAAGAGAGSARKRKAAAGDASPGREKRLRRFRPQPPQSFGDVYARALGQRFYVLGRRRGGTDECPEETFELAGSTGNVYTVHVGRAPSCNCPHAEKGNQCKHVLYILARVLQAPPDLVYQLALLSSELRLIFAGAPTVDAAAAGGGGGGKRKPIEGDCPICFCELEAASPGSAVWCRAACGQNLHRECFDMWARTKKGQVTCPFCRSAWAEDPAMPSRVRMDRAAVSEGYANVADQLGMSGIRDTSSYSLWYGYH